MHEGLDKYVRRILKEKELTLSDVERRAEGSISDSYVSSISAGNIKNLSLDKLKALARGLGVTESQVFAAACGVSLPDVEEFCESEFAQFFYKYRELSDEDKRQLSVILAILDREIDRRLLLSDIRKREGLAVSAKSGNGHPQHAQTGSQRSF